MKYKLIRSKRKSVAINITDGVVTVKAPQRTSMEYIENFVAQKAGWIEKKLAEYDSKVGMFKPVLDGAAIMLDGEVLPINMTDKVKRVKLNAGALDVPVKCENDLSRAVAGWYKRIAKAELKAKLDALSAATGLSYGEFALTNARGKWGSCDADCNIRLNWRLVMLDRDTANYVMIHELAHTVHHDHSAAFWTEVEKHYPAAATAKKKLKQYSVLTALYR